jgi:inner membrane protein
MKFNLAVKCAAISVIALGLLLFLQMIEYKVDERNRYRFEAKNAIAQGWSGSQIVVSPILRLTYSKDYDQEVFDENLDKYVVKRKTKKWYELHVPDSLKLDGQVQIQERYKGIYRVPVYEAIMVMEGQFSKIPKVTERLLRAELISSLSDMRGISVTPKLRWNNDTITMQAAKDSHLLGNYISADITDQFQGTAQLEASFSMKMNIRGLDVISFVPAGKQVVTTLSSEWPHPYFEGRYLPESRQISDAGFKAKWSMSEFATSIQQTLQSCQLSRDQCVNALRGNSFGVGLHNPIDVYQKTDRSMKYGFLFILLTFLVFCLFEVIKRVQIHPVQYALVGAALAIFYLLLISLSEHISFAMSYLIATFACVSLIWFYLMYVFKNMANASMLSLGIATLYAMLYVILKSEDFALLMGTGLTFISLGTLMVVTRNINWYSLGLSKEEG